MRFQFAITIVLAASCGCQQPDNAQKPQDSSPDYVLHNWTVGSLCELVDYQSVRVTGYSLVWGLAGTGSRECPTRVRQFLVQYLRQSKSQLRIEGYDGLTAEQIIASPDTAVVLVTGTVPAGAPRGEAFDVTVTALPATQTTSLQGGYLLETELRIAARSQSGTTPMTRQYAIASGPTFINPFSRPDGVKTDPRRAHIIGNARSLYDRRIGLALLNPDYRTAEMIQNSINSRFPGADGDRTADATRTAVTLRIPPEYRDDHAHFVDLISALFLQSRPGYLENKLREIDELLSDGRADFNTVGLAWEAIGRTALPFVTRHYDDSDQRLAFHAARTALRLGDAVAVDVLIRIANNDDHPERLRAVQALGRATDDPRGRTALLHLLEQPNARARMLAYDALRKARDPAIASTRLPGGFTLDIVPGPKKDHILCVWAAKRTGVVLFGGPIQCPDNVFLESPDSMVTINVEPKGNHFTVTRKRPGGRGYATAQCPLTIARLVRTLALPLPAPRTSRKIDPGLQLQRQGPTGLGLTFSQITGILQQLCEENVVDAAFYLHRTEDDLNG